MLRLEAINRAVTEAIRNLPEPQKQKTRHRRVILNSGARTRTNAEGVEQRACRAGPEGVSCLQRIIERCSMKSPLLEKQKPAFWAGSLE